MKNKNSTYLLLTILLVILSTIGGYFLFTMYQGSNLVNYTSSTVPKIELLPTDSIEQPIQIEPTVIATNSPTLAQITSTPTSTTTPKLVPTTIPTKSISSTKDTILYQSKDDFFSVSYNSNRQLHQDTEPSGNRYTFVNKAGNFAIHVSQSDKWSWTHPDRQFTSTLLVSGKNTFRYDIASQTIIDLQSTENNYTLQCIHNGLESLKTECDQFVSSFKIL